MGLMLGSLVMLYALVVKLLFVSMRNKRYALRWEIIPLWRYRLALAFGELCSYAIAILLLILFMRLTVPADGEFLALIPPLSLHHFIAGFSSILLLITIFLSYIRVREDVIGLDGNTIISPGTGLWILPWRDVSRMKWLHRSLPEQLLRVRILCSDGMALFEFRIPSGALSCDISDYEKVWKLLVGQTPETLASKTLLFIEEALNQVAQKRHLTMRQTTSWSLKKSCRIEGMLGEVPITWNGEYIHPVKILRVFDTVTEM